MPPRKYTKGSGKYKPQAGSKITGAQYAGAFWRGFRQGLYDGGNTQAESVQRVDLKGIRSMMNGNESPTTDTQAENHAYKRGVTQGVMFRALVEAQEFPGVTLPPPGTDPGDEPDIAAGGLSDYLGKTGDVVDDLANAGMDLMGW